MASSEAQQEFDELMRNKEHRTTHPEDDHETKINHVEPENKTPEPALPRQSMNSTRDTIPVKRQGANTGPKGVISDAQNFRESAREHRSARASTTIAREEPTPTFGQRELIEALDKIIEDGNDDLEEDLDDEFVSQWRQQRLQALRGGDYSSGLQGQLQYGGLSTVDGEGYLEAIEQSPGVVVVFISDDVSEVSQLFEGCLRMLARKHHNTKFVKLAYDEAEIQAEGVPGIIAYRNGDKFAALIPLLDEMPDDGDLDAETLEKVLQRHQILR